MKRYADYEKFNPFRVPGWRWARVERLVGNWPQAGRSSTRDDAWIKKAKNFLCRWPRGDEDTREKIFWEMPGLTYAYEIHERRISAPATALFLEARLLAGQTPEYIAEQMSTMPDTIRWYEALFFDVSKHLHQRDWITSVVLMPPIMRHLGGFRPTEEDDEAVETAVQRRRRLHDVVPVALPFLDASLKYFSYFGGPIMADLMIHGALSGHVLASKDDLPQWLDNMWALNLKRRSMQAAAQVEINKWNVMDLFMVHARIMELEKSDDTREQQRSGVERHVRALLDDLPFRVGVQADDASSHLRLYKGLPGELRDIEIMSDESVPAEVLAQPLPEPRPRQSQPAVADTQTDFV